MSRNLCFYNAGQIPVIWTQRDELDRWEKWPQVFGQILWKVTGNHCYVVASWSVEWGYLGMINRILKQRKQRGMIDSNVIHSKEINLYSCWNVLAVDLLSRWSAFVLYLIDLHLALIRDLFLSIYLQMGFSDHVFHLSRHWETHTIKTLIWDLDHLDHSVWHSMGKLQPLKFTWVNKYYVNNRSITSQYILIPHSYCYKPSAICKVQKSDELWKSSDMFNLCWT
jgi:hypothetical protein